MSNEIIESYKKVLANSKNRKVLQEETPYDRVNKKNKQDPFEKFLEKLSTVKVTKPTKQPKSEPTEELESLYEKTAAKLPSVEPIIFKKPIASVIDQSAKIQKEDPLKAFVENLALTLKQQKEQNEKPEKEEEEKEEQNNVSQENIPNEQEVSSEQQAEDTTDVYVQQLQDKNTVQISDEDAKLKSLIDSQLVVSLDKYKQQQQFPNYGFTGGGGGTNAVQYVEGGTMHGDLNVMGRFLSGGIDLATLFFANTATVSNGGGGVTTNITNQLSSGEYTLTLNSDGSVTFPNNTIAPDDDQILNIESGHTETGDFTRIALSPYGFFAYDGKSNSITLDSVDNDIILTTLDTYEWKFSSEGILIGPNNILTVTELSTTGKILSGGKDLTEIFASKDHQFNTDEEYTLYTSDIDQPTPISLDCSTNQTFYVTSSANQNWTANLVNLPVLSGHATKVTIIIEQGAESYVPTSLQINNVNQTIQWANATSPSGNPSKTDFIQFKILNNNGTYIVYGQINTFGTPSPTLFPGNVWNDAITWNDLLIFDNS